MEKPYAAYRTYVDKRNGRSKYRSNCNACNIARIEAIKKGMSVEDRKKYHRRIKIRHKYGMSEGDYQRLLEDQNYLCAICGKKETWKRVSECVPLAVDHDHLTGKVRGLLCIRCNLLIGKAGDSPELLMRCIEYLTKSRDNHGSFTFREW